MHKVLKNILNADDIKSIRQDVIDNLSLSYNSKQTDTTSDKSNIKSYNVRRIDHMNISKLKILTSKMLNEKLIDEIYKIFGKFYLINRMELTINGFSPAVHRDGQSMGWNKSALIDGKDLFRVILYANLKYDEHIIKFGRFNSNPIEISNSENTFSKINYFIEHYIKKKFLKKIFIKPGDMVFFDYNTWHSANSNFNPDLGEIQKIYVSIDFSTNLEVAKRCVDFLRKKFDIKTSLNDYSNKNLSTFLSENKKMSILNL